MSRRSTKSTVAERATDRPGDVSPFALGLLLRRAHNRAATAMVAAVRPFGLELRHFALLIVLADRGPTPQRDLVAASGFDKAAIMRAVDDLEEAGYAVRKSVPGDRRVREVVITPGGLEVFDAAHERAQGIAADLVAHLAPGEADRLMDILTRFTYPPE